MPECVGWVVAEQGAEGRTPLRPSCRDDDHVCTGEVGLDVLHMAQVNVEEENRCGCNKNKVVPT